MRSRFHTRCRAYAPRKRSVGEIPFASVETESPGLMNTAVYVRLRDALVLENSLASIAVTRPFVKEPGTRREILDV